MEFRNGILLQLFECIESTQNEVKRKMIKTGASNDAPKSLRNVSPLKKKFARREFDPLSKPEIDKRMGISI
jgi:hypothetical protein